MGIKNTLTKNTLFAKDTSFKKNLAKRTVL
jgi:hypothetical protein